MRSLSAVRLPWRIGIFLFLSALPLAVLFGAKSAAIRLPEGFESVSSEIRFSGFGGFNRGNFTGGDYRGQFTRIESRLGLFDPLYVANKGKSGFTIDDVGGAPIVTAECRAIERTATVRVVTIDLKKLAYSCEFAGPMIDQETRFVLGEPKRDGFREKLLARDRRTAEALILGHELSIASVHEYATSKLKSQAPLGYLIEADGIVVGTVDLLDWNPIVRLRDDLTESQQRATMTAALALSVLRDPANSTLEDVVD